jgi:hypothetical protein
MKRIVLAAAIAILAATGVAGVPGVAGAKEVGTSLTLRARDYHYWRHRHHHRGWWNHYAGCRVVVRSHINRWGERVFVRRRICY